LILVFDVADFLPALKRRGFQVVISLDTLSKSSEAGRELVIEDGLAIII
jgi:hypothetical protein